MQGDILTLSGVTRTFPNGVIALQDIDLAARDGDILVLLGPSGCGKSTLLRLIAGLDQPDSGKIRWKTPPGPGEIGYVFQDSTLMPWASAAENVALPRRLRGDRQAEEKASAMLRLVGLGDFCDARPHTLSGGMRMRVSIARALVSRPRLLLMDEPFAALDEFTRHNLQDELLRLAAEFGCTVIFVTHSLYEAAYLGTTIVLMTPRPGRIATRIGNDLPVPRDRLGTVFGAKIGELTSALRALHIAA